MPNIEIHGAEAGRAQRIKEKIFKIFEPLGFIDDLVVEIHLDRVVNHLDQDQPFFRVFHTSFDDLAAILDKLRPFKLDIEHVLLSGFIPRYDHNEDPNDRLERSAEARYEDT